jgi:hypothetical protein
MSAGQWWREQFCQSNKMFKALNTQTDKEIIILDREWLDCVNHLRALDRQDVLVCPECKQPVRVRAGEIKRWHFAHKHLQDCPLQHESPQILQARALLYQWLVSKFESAAVTLEKKLDRDFLPRPVDCWVETKQDRFAYWIVEAQVKPQQRDAFLDGFDALGVNIHWVFLTRMLNENEESPGEIFLTTTEREFRHSSEYDQIGQSFTSASHDHGLSLHYLDPDGETLTTYRSLHLVHEPQVYAGRKERHALVDMLVLGSTGEFVHPGEHEQLQAWKEEKVEYEVKQKKLEEKQRREQQEAQKRWEDLQRDYSAFRVEHFVPPRTPVQPKQDDPKPAGYTQVLSSTPKEAVCELCGQVTSDWYTYDNKTKKCKCMDCYRRMSS